MGKYFDSFPIISYAGTMGRNLADRPIMKGRLAEILGGVMLPYTMHDGTRLDNLSYDYYKDSDFVWMIALANSMTDLYYDTPLAETDFSDLIVEKYGSMSAATTNIVAFWRSNWRDDDSILTPTGFANLSDGQKAYWNPVLDYLGDVSVYQRKQEDLMVTTNKVVSIAGSGSGSITDGERLTISGQTACWSVSSNSSALIVQHVVGALANGSVLTGVSSGSTLTITNSTVVAQPIADDLAGYWGIVMVYEAEVEKNEAKRQVFLVDNRISAEVAKQLKDAML